MPAAAAHSWPHRPGSVGRSAHAGLQGPRLLGMDLGGLERRNSVTTHRPASFTPHQEDWEFKVIIGSIVNWRPAWGTRDLSNPRKYESVTGLKNPRVWEVTKRTGPLQPPWPCCPIQHCLGSWILGQDSQKTAPSRIVSPDFHLGTTGHWAFFFFPLRQGLELTAILLPKTPGLV